MCFCEDQNEEVQPKGVPECTPSVCMARTIEAWDNEFDDEVCFCEQDQKSTDSSWPALSISKGKKKIQYNYITNMFL